MTSYYLRVPLPLSIDLPSLDEEEDDDGTDRGEGDDSEARLDAGGVAVGLVFLLGLD